MAITTAEAAGYLTIEQVAGLKGRSTVTVRTWIESGALDAMRIPTRSRRSYYLVRTADAAAFEVPPRGRPWPPASGTPPPNLRRPPARH